MLTADQVAFYRENGYLAVEGVLPVEQVKAMEEVTLSFIDQSRTIASSNEVFDLGPDHSKEHANLRRLRDPERQHVLFEAVHKNEAVLEVLAYLLGPNIRAHSSKLNLKEPGASTAVEWHQDWGFGGATNDDLLTVGITLNDMTVENGCLMVLPASHRGKIWSHHLGDDFVGAITDPEFGVSAAVPIEQKPGDISIHHIRTVHGSAPNISSIPRHLLLFTYSAADAWPLTGVQDLDDYDRKMLRGNPVNAPRLEKVPLERVRATNQPLDSLFVLQDKLTAGTYR